MKVTHAQGRRAISTIVATILVVAMTIVAGGILYTYFSTVATRAQVTNQVQVSADLAVAGGTGTGTAAATVTNSGSVALTGLSITGSIIPSSVKWNPVPSSTARARALTLAMLLDENGRILLQNDPQHFNLYSCSKCFTKSDSPTECMKHALNCKKFSNLQGIIRVNSRSPKNLLDLVDFMGSMSARDQGLDSSVTSSDHILNTDGELRAGKICWILFDPTPVAYITVSKRGIDEDRKLYTGGRRGRLVYSFDDLFVVAHKRRQGLATSLLTYVAKELRKKLSDFVYNHPTEATVRLLLKLGVRDAIVWG